MSTWDYLHAWAADSLHLDTMPKLGRRPTTAQCEAGPRIELPVSVPSAIIARFAATAPAAPPLDPVTTFTHRQLK
jgi:hypothetical protein